MNDISNRTLALLLVTAIVVSLGTTLLSVNKLGTLQAPTGRAGSDQGRVNLTVESTLSIFLEQQFIDFGSGYVNTSCALATHANLTIEDKTYTDLNDCWTSQTGAPAEPSQPFVVQNDGNQNVTLEVRGPAPISFFSGYTGSQPYNLSWKGRNNDSNSCASAKLNQSWNIFSGDWQLVCSGSSFQDGDTSDEIGVDIRVVIPEDLPTGLYENTTVTFRAT